MTSDLALVMRLILKDQSYAKIAVKFELLKVCAKYLNASYMALTHLGNE